MVTTHPYNMWPLHVKFFTSTSKKVWDEATVSQPLPSGMTLTEEYEGVDGKSGVSGSGRVGPIDVTDGKRFHTGIGSAFAEERTGQFSAHHMQKSSLIRTTLRDPKCMICSKSVENYHSVRYIDPYPVRHSHRIWHRNL